MLTDSFEKTNGVVFTRLLSVGWVLLFLYACLSFGGQQLFAGLLSPFTRNLVEQTLLTAFFLVSSIGYFKKNELLAFAVICFVISNLFENTSVLYGFPFGKFHHSEVTGPRLFTWLLQINDGAKN